MKRFVIFLLIHFFLFVSAGLFGESAIELYNEGEKALSLGNVNSAIEKFKASLQVNSNYYKPMKGLARAFLLIGQYEEALNYIKKAERYDRGNVELLTIEGEILIGLGEFEKARAIFNSILEREPNNINAKFGLAELDIANGQKRLAAERYLETLKIAPENRKALLSLTLIYDKLKDREASSRYLELALRYHSNNPSVHLIAALHMEGEGKYDRAKKHLELALSLNPDYLDALLAITELYLREKNYSKAIEFATRIVNKDKGNELGWYLLGLAYKEKGDIDRSVNTFISLLNMYPDDEVARIVLENILITNMENKNLKDIREKLSDYHYNRGKLFESRNYIETAREEYRRALILMPDSKDARFRFAKIFKMEGYPIKYLSELRVLKKLGYNDTMINDEIEIYSNLDDASIAKKWGIDQYGLRKEQYSVVLVMLRSDMNITEKKHPFFEGEFIKYYSSFLKVFDNIKIADERIVKNFSEAFRIARDKGADYFFVLQYEELERSFSVDTTIYYSGTGSRLKYLEEYRTGNDRVKDAVISITKKVHRLFPLRGRILAKEFDNGLIDLGAMDGVKKDDELLIIKRDALKITSSSIGVKFKKEDILGKFKITEIDERVCEGRIINNSFFDMVNPGDNVIYSPVIPQETKQERKESKSFLKRMLGL